MVTEHSASWEDATRCSKCLKPGVDIGSVNAPSRQQGKIHTIECQNPLCLQFEERWIVQVRANGQIPVRDAGLGAKSFPTMSPGQEAMARMQLEQIEEERRRGEVERR